MASWTDERVELLKKLWADGLSASQIARELGEVTRNAVIGKVHRLGLSGRVTKTRIERPRPRPVLRPPPRPLPPAIERIEPLMLEDGRFTTITTLKNSSCRWPIGEPGTSDFHFCGHAQAGGTPYCETHARLAYQPIQKNRQRASG